MLSRTGKLYNWSGSVELTPQKIFEPESEEELASLVAQAAKEGRDVRVIGSLHSSSGVIDVDHYAVSLKRMSGLISSYPERHQAVLWAGTTLIEAGQQLFEHDLSLVNFGDVATQTLAGAVGTGTHGTGRDIRNLSSMLIGGRLVTANGGLVDFNEENDPEFLKAIRVSFGAFGIFTRLHLQLVPSYQLERREYCVSMQNCLEHLDELVNENHNFDFYWYPRSDVCKLRLLNAKGAGSKVNYGKLVELRSDWAHEIIPKHSGLPFKFDESEYAVPLEHSRECFLEVRKHILRKWRRHVGWRVLWRTIAADDTFLSTAHGRNTATISLHQNSSLSFEPFFREMQPIFEAFHARPHWAKKHYMSAKALEPLYPKWQDFHSIRRQMDPNGVFLSEGLAKLFGEPLKNKSKAKLIQPNNPSQRQFENPIRHSTVRDNPGAVGKTRWAIAAGYIPMQSKNEEPYLTSCNRISVLNTGSKMTNIRITIFFEDRESVGPFRLEVGPERLRRFRVNDLIFPEAVPLQTNYSAVIDADSPVVVQFTCQYTTNENTALTGTMAFPFEVDHG